MDRRFLPSSSSDRTGVKALDDNEIRPTICPNSDRHLHLPWVVMILQVSRLFLNVGFRFCSNTSDHRDTKNIGSSSKIRWFDASRDDKAGELALEDRLW